MFNFTVVMAGVYQSGRDWEEPEAMFLSLTDAKWYLTSKYLEIITIGRGAIGVASTWFDSDGTAWCVDLDNGEQISASIRESEELS